MDAVTEGVESAGWELSGLQKTTSEEFRGRWAGESTRSAYLFFHHPDLEESVSLDGFLDETSRGLHGNLSLVVDGPTLGNLAPAPKVLEMARRASQAHLLEGYTTPITLRIVLPDEGEPVQEAEAELRFKLTMPRTAMNAGASSTSALCSAAARAFESLLQGLSREGFWHSE